MSNNTFSCMRNRLLETAEDVNRKKRHATTICGHISSQILKAFVAIKSNTTSAQGLEMLATTRRVYLDILSEFEIGSGEAIAKQARFKKAKKCRDKRVTRNLTSYQIADTATKKGCASHLCRGFDAKSRAKVVLTE